MLTLGEGASGPPDSGVDGQNLVKCFFQTQAGYRDFSAGRRENRAAPGPSSLHVCACTKPTVLPAALKVSAAIQTPSHNFGFGAIHAWATPATPLHNLRSCFACAPPPHLYRLGAGRTPLPPPHPRLVHTPCSLIQIPRSLLPLRQISLAPAAGRSLQPATAHACIVTF